jgi:excisionase family DNA binding protein
MAGKEVRVEERHLSLSEAADALDISERTAYRWIKSGKLRAYKPGRDYWIPESAVKEVVEESKVRPKADSRSSLQLPLNGFVNGFEDERRAVWDAAADQARRLREDGRARMDDLLASWRASRERGQPRAARSEYMDEMGNLLQEVYDADMTLGEAYIEAALTQGDSKAKVPRYLQEESRATSHFYGELLGLVQSAGLSVRTGNDAAAAKRAAKVQSGRRPHSVEETKAA